MTVQAGIEVETDLELLVGDMPAIPCEHHQHASLSSQHGGPATHYIQCRCPECGEAGSVRAACEPFVKHSRTGSLRCPHCNSLVDGVKSVIILAPINSATR
jgi:phage FluMu protein Com